MRQLSAREITRRIQMIDPLVNIIIARNGHYWWQRTCPKHAGQSDHAEMVGQSLGSDYDAMCAKLLQIYGAHRLDLSIHDEPELPPAQRAYAQEWDRAIDWLHDLIALSVYRGYVTPPQLSDLLDLLKQCRELVARYSADEQELLAQGGAPSAVVRVQSGHHSQGYDQRSDGGEGCVYKSDTCQICPIR